MFPNQLTVSPLTGESLLRDPVRKTATTAASLADSGMVLSSEAQTPTVVTFGQKLVK